MSTIKKIEKVIGFSCTTLLHRQIVYKSNFVCICCNIVFYSRMRSLRYLAVSKLIKRSVIAEDFLDFGVDLEELRIIGSTINRIEGSAFQHVRTIKTLDLSENNIDFIDPFAFAEVKLFLEKYLLWPFTMNRN